MRSKVLFEQDSFCPSLGRCPAITRSSMVMGRPVLWLLGLTPIFDRQLYR